MIRFTFLKRREPRGFDYFPRYYDPQKEELEKKIRNAEAEMGKTDENGERIRREISFRQKSGTSWKSSEVRKAAVASSLRLIVILVLLCVVFYFIYTSLDKFVAKLL